MNNLETKKWFVYIGDHHEGPFSVGEIQAKVTTGEVAANQYVWCDGMADWQLMADVPDFQTPQAPAAPELPPVHVETLGSAPSSHGFEMTPASNTGVDMTREPSAVFQAPAAILGDEPKPFEQEEPTRRRAVPKKPERSEGVSMRRVVLYLLVAGVISLGGWLYSRGVLDGLASGGSVASITAATVEKVRSTLVQYAEKLPWIADWVSPIPRLSDVSEAEYRDLKAAIKEGTPQSPRVALALSTENLKTPSFYLSSSLPSGAKFEISVRGNGETLLNHIEFFSATRATLDGRLAKTLPLRMKDGSPLPLGEYTVSVYDAEAQPDAVAALLSSRPPHEKAGMEEVPRTARVLIQRLYFLGGERDGAYETRLKSFHDNLRKKAQDELVELKQFSATMDSQLAASRAQFRKFRGATPAKANRRGWAAFATDWSKLSIKLNAAADAWTADSLKTSVFYGVLYERLKNVNTLVNKTHETFHQYFIGRVDIKSFDTQSSALVAEALKQIADLKGAIAKAEAMPASPSGMPVRSGL